MSNTAIEILCANPRCQSVNRHDAARCHECGSPLVLRYLRAVGEGVSTCPPGTLMGDRYRVCAPEIVLDTKPGQPPHVTQTIPDGLLPYFQLFPQRLHIPQIYGFTTYQHQLVWLFEYGSIPMGDAAQPQAPNLLLGLTSVWESANSLRQLNWLWQIAQLWQPLKRLNQSATLLNLELLRTNGGLLQVWELQPDKNRSPELTDLGKAWRTLIPNSAKSIRQLLTHLCQAMERERLTHCEQLLAFLDKAIVEVSQQSQRSYRLYCRTDQGPTRDHNEDACFPPDDKVIYRDDALPDQPQLLLVCDGLGGQDGGEIASDLAISSLQATLVDTSWVERGGNAGANLLKLERAIAQANDVICDRNDQESRIERQRMGTTLVLAMALGPELYCAHVGDSRIYRITSSGCHQITVDDDLASREVQLGYAFYREASRYPSAGALVQALGMDKSTLLRSNIHRFILDEDCLFLLCSDGLSDFDRVEQYWSSELLPVLAEERDVVGAVNQLLNIANTENGHDNATVGLLHCQVSWGPHVPSVHLSDLEVLANESANPLTPSSLLNSPIFRWFSACAGVIIALILVGTNLPQPIQSRLLPFLAEPNRIIQPQN
ncbi:MAG: protein phosphatase 2C domain-containing protein [Cyanobacteria bacterium P01_H01_bin.15]